MSWWRHPRPPGSGRIAGRPRPGGGWAPREVSSCPPLLTYPGSAPTPAHRRWRVRCAGRHARKAESFARIRASTPFPSPSRCPDPRSLLLLRRQRPEPGPCAARSHRPVAASPFPRPGAARRAIRPNICPSSPWCIHQCHRAAHRGDSPSRTTRALRRRTATALPRRPPFGTAGRPDLGALLTPAPLYPSGPQN